METILIIEDDVKLAGLLSAYLSKYEFRTIIVEDFNRVLETFYESSPNLVLLDVNLPRYDGFYWCRQIRTTSLCPILFISARDSGMDQVMALENGGDDYITKPFHYEVVLAKIRSHLRRAYGSYSQLQEERKLQSGELILYPERYMIQCNGQASELTQKEAILLEALLLKKGRVVNRPGNDDQQAIELVSLSAFNELAPQMNINAIDSLTGGEAEMLIHSQYTPKDYTTNQVILLKELNDQRLVLRDVQIPDVYPLSPYADSILIVDDALYDKFLNTAANTNNLFVNYYYKIPAWDDSPPMETSLEAVITKELIQWNKDLNTANNEWDNLLTSRAQSYLYTKQGAATFSFIGIFIALIFSLSSASFLFFKLHTELNVDKQMYKALSKIGLSAKEMAASATRQISVLFYIPIVVATIQTLVVIHPVLKQMNITSVTVPVLITSALFLAVQTIYFVIARSRYIQSLKKIMV